MVQIVGILCVVSFSFLFILSIMRDGNHLQAIGTILAIGFLSLILTIAYYGNKVVDELKTQKKVVDTTAIAEPEKNGEIQG